MSQQPNFEIVVGATLPTYTVDLIDGSTNAPIADITSAAVVFTMRRSDGESVTVDPVTIVDGPLARVEVPWVAADTDTAGDFFGRFTVTYPSTAIWIWPNTEAKVLVRVLCNT